MVYVLQFANNCFSAEQHSDLICNQPLFPIPSDSFAPETEVHGTVILAHRTLALHGPNHLGYPDNQYNLGNPSNQSDMKVISDENDMMNKLKQCCWLNTTVGGCIEQIILCHWNMQICSMLNSIIDNDNKSRSKPVYVWQQCLHTFHTSYERTKSNEIHCQSSPSCQKLAWQLDTS